MAAAAMGANVDGRPVAEQPCPPIFSFLPSLPEEHIMAVFVVECRNSTISPQPCWNYYLSNCLPPAACDVTARGFVYSWTTSRQGFLLGLIYLSLDHQLQHLACLVLWGLI